MPFDNCQKFKAAFLLQCSHLGLSPEETLGIAKTAAAMFRGELPTQVKEADLNPAWLLAPLGAAAGAGALVGNSLGHLPAVETADPGDAQLQEKIDAYRRLAHRIRLQDSLRDKQLKAPPPYSRL